MNYPFEKRAAGLYFAPGDFYIDPKRSVERAIISHAHADHANPINKQAWCTPGTGAIMKTRYAEKLKSVLNLVPYRQPFQFGSTTITFYPAGHILGSAQIVIDFENVRYCYTGDFKLREDVSCEPFEIVLCDTLITETTFAHPEYAHPPEAVEFEKLDTYKNMNVVIGAYNLGKAQRLTLLLNKFHPDRCIMVHHESAIFHKLYEQAGFNLGGWVHYNYRLFRQTKGNILIVPPRALSTYSATVGVVTTFATGWKTPPFKSHFNFFLSDHADWNEILHLIKATGAKEIITVHGDGNFLKSHLSEVANQLKVSV
jgi:putative mRNA 3-end processing factor